MGMSDEARALREINKALRQIAAELEDMNERAEQEERARFASPYIPESCPKERRWTDPAAAATCGTCRRFWSCPYPPPAQDPKGGK